MASDAVTAALAQGVIGGRTHAAGECMERFKQLLGRHKAEAAQVPRSEKLRIVRLI
jgi:hypothetical protein